MATSEPPSKQIYCSLEEAEVAQGRLKVERKVLKIYTQDPSHHTKVSESSPFATNHTYRSSILAPIARKHNIVSNGEIGRGTQIDLR